MKELEGRTVLVTDPQDVIGWGAAVASRDAGARLILPSPTDDGVDRLDAEFGDDARIVRTDVGAENGLGEVLRAIAADGGLDHVVVPMGSWWPVGAADVDPSSDELQALLGGYTTRQMRMVEDAAPMLRSSGGSYTLVTGAAGEAPHIHGAGLLVAAVKAQLALAERLKAEHEDDGFRFNEFRIAVRVEREPRPGVVPAAEVGRVLVGILAGDARSQTIRYPEG